MESEMTDAEKQMVVSMMVVAHAAAQDKGEPPMNAAFTAAGIEALVDALRVGVTYLNATVYNGAVRPAKRKNYSEAASKLEKALKDIGLQP
jgi:hypothetical protein